MKKAIHRILTLAFSLILLAGAIPLSVAADYPIWDGAAMTVTMKPGEEAFYIYVPAADGPYTISQSTSVIRTSFEQAGEIDKDAEPIPVHVEGKANPNDECYRLKGGVRYLVRMYVHSMETEWADGITDTISIYAGEPKKEEDLCEPIDLGSHKLTVKPGEEMKYKFTPSTSGRYVLYSENTIVNIRLRHGLDSLDTSENQLFVANPFGKAFGYFADMTAGETYIITFSMWENEPYPEGFTDTYHLEKASGAKFAEIRSAHDHEATKLYGYVGGSINPFVYTDPIYYEGFVTDWAVSDNTIADFISPDDNELALKKAGTVTVTAKVDGKTMSATIQVKDRPVLTLNETVKLTFGGTLGVQCAFTPAESGTYRFSLTGGGGTTVIQGTDYAIYWEGSGSLTATLTAGKTYILEGPFGTSDYTVKVTKGGSGSAATTPAPPSGDQPTDSSTTNSTAPSSAPTETEGTTPPTKAPVHVEDGKAQVKYEEVAHLLNGDTLTVTVEDTTVTAVAIPTRVLTEAAEADTALRVELSHATVALDASVLANVAEQTDGDTIELSVEQVEAAALSKQQQSTLKNKNVAAVVRILLNGDTEIHQLGGTAAVTIPFVPAEGRSLSDYVVYYVTDGEPEKMKTVAVDGRLTFYTTHFSDYTLVYEPQRGKQVKGGTDENTPFPIGKTILYSVIALLLIAGAGVAVVIITKHQANNNNQKH